MPVLRPVRRYLPQKGTEATPNFELAQLEHGKLMIILGEGASKNSKTEG